MLDKFIGSRSALICLFFMIIAMFFALNSIFFLAFNLVIIIGYLLFYCKVFAFKENFLTIHSLLYLKGKQISYEELKSILIIYTNGSNGRVPLIRLTFRNSIIRKYRALFFKNDLIRLSNEFFKRDITVDLINF